MEPQPGSQQPDLIIGQTIGNYLVTQKLGEGGMGSVYLAEHPTIGKKVALKILHPEFSSNEDVTKRFFHEAKAVNDIGHPNIVDIVDYGVLQSGDTRLVYFIMEYLSGNTLSTLIRTESPLAPERAFTIALQVADALSASHKCGIVHRDLKPDNIMLQQRGRERDFVKLLDFGIAKLTTEGGVSKGRTQTGMVLGTPAYMSPEQCEGRGNVDHRTDVYALGIVLYEMLTGQVPFKGDGYGEVLIQHLTQMPDPPSKYRMLSLHLEAVVMKALQKRAEMRYPNMDEMMRAIADPVAYVESHGGLQGFLQAQLMPSNAPLPSMRFTPPASYTSSQPSMTPAPGYMPTPVPGMQYSSQYGAASISQHGTATTSQLGMQGPPSQHGMQKPTTLGGASGQIHAPKSKTGYFVIGGLVVAAAAIAVIVVASGKKADEAVAIGGSNAVASEGSAASAGSATKPVDPPPGSATPQPGSAGTVAAGSNTQTGSATPQSGSATTSAGSASGEIVRADVARITLRTKPEGARIFVNGLEIPQKTPAPFVLPHSKDPVKIVLRLDKHEDVAFPLTVTGNYDHEYVLKKKRSVPVSGRGSATGTGSSGRNDTGLMRPDDL